MGVSRKILNWYAKLSPNRGYVTPPYSHVVQIGDPVLRKKSEAVPIEKIRSVEVQTVIRRLEHVLNKFGSVGMSAPQIGVNMRIFVMQHTYEQIAATQHETVTKKGMHVVPYTVFINPVMKVKDYNKLVYQEGCESIRGFSAEVPRFSKIEVLGYDANGDNIQRIYKDWAARIVQHEIDHLDGKLYTDIMNVKSLSCTCWEEVNLSQGKVKLPFTPE